ncbi:MAG: HAD family hydrolase [Verrucomicrobiales bacterium]
MQAPQLLLFDIDGTLLWSKSGIAALNQAAKEIWPSAPDDALTNVEISGRTDRAIARDMVSKFHGEFDEAVAITFLQAYLQNLHRNLVADDPGIALPGVIPLLERLKNAPHLTLALLTGNLVAGAEIKLGHYKLWDYFAFGAFADDSEIRNELGPVALERARRHLGVTPSQVFIIGDTPHDIACGRVIDAKILAVATGSHSLDELAEHQPDHLVTSLEDVEAICTQCGW